MLEPKVWNKIKGLEKTTIYSGLRFLEKCLLNGLGKLFFKAKSTQNIKLSIIFGGFRGLNNSSYQHSEATFRQ